MEENKKKKERKKLSQILKEVDWKYASFALVISIGFILLGIFVFKESYLRAGETFVDLWNSLKFYFLNISDKGNIEEITVTNYSKYLTWATFLPENGEGLKQEIIRYLNLLVDKNNFLDWLDIVGEKSGAFAKVLVIILPIVMILYMLLKKIYLRDNDAYDVDSIPLVIWKKIEEKTFVKIKNYIVGFIGFIKSNNEYLTLWLITWLLNTNLMSVIVDFIAYYLFFVSVFEFSGLYDQFAKLFVDLQVIIKYFSFAIPIALYIWTLKKRLDAARDKLEHYEMKNRGFINELPIVSMTCGSMGKRKTTIITDMALSQEVMFRDVAFQKIKKLDMMFPVFPWVMLENGMKEQMGIGSVYNLATVKEWVRGKEKQFKEDPCEENIFNYEFKRYGMTFNDRLKLNNIWDVIETYAKLYFIYIIQSSLIVGNYSIRSDTTIEDFGFFPFWNDNFFPSGLNNVEAYSHILDFDTLRLGKKMIENNPKIGSFEFGVVNISEVGKERGNSLELKEIKKGEEETNQKNDLFNSWLKMCRHSATVDNYPFIKVFTDEQRPSSWGADARDLCDIVNIISSGETKVCIFGYERFEQGFVEAYLKWFMKFYYDIRHIRGDNLLLVYLLKKIAAFLHKIDLIAYNKYGYSVAYIEKERGTMDGEVENRKNYILNQKIYSRRFSTDCFSDYFDELAKGTKIGFDDYETYGDVKATVEELKKQNSFFINALYKDKEK